MTLREQLKSVEEQTGRKPKELEDLVELPASCYESWAWFSRLHNKRTSGGFSVNPLQYSDIKAFFDLQGIIPELWEIRLIEQWDEIVLKEYNEKSKKSSKAAKPR